MACYTTVSCTNVILPSFVLNLYGNVTWSDSCHIEPVRFADKVVIWPTVRWDHSFKTNAVIILLLYYYTSSELNQMAKLIECS